MKKTLSKGFTLVEIMIVVAIIGLLAAIAIPSFQKSRETTRTNTCIGNMRMLQAAKEQWALAESKNENDAPFWTNLQVYVRGEEPSCPVNDAYYSDANKQFNAVSNNIACPNYNTPAGSYTDHVL